MWDNDALLLGALRLGGAAGTGSTATSRVLRVTLLDPPSALQYLHIQHIMVQSRAKIILRWQTQVPGIGALKKFEHALGPRLQDGHRWNTKVLVGVGYTSQLLLWLLATDAVGCRSSKGTLALHGSTQVSCPTSPTWGARGAGAGGAWLARGGWKWRDQRRRWWALQRGVGGMVWRCWRGVGGCAPLCLLGSSTPLCHLGSAFCIHLQQCGVMLQAAQRDEECRVLIGV